MKLILFLGKTRKIWFRIQALIIKEILAVWRDPKSRFAMVGPPLLQLFIFSHAVTLEVTNISIGVHNQDLGWYSHELVERIEGSPYVSKVFHIRDNKEVKRIIDTQQAIVIVQFQQDFSRELAAGKQGTVQLILDGRRSNAAQIVTGYVNQIFQGFNKDILKRKGFDVPEPIVVESRAFFNPNLDYIFYTGPSLVAILSMLIAITVTSLSVARERENGTFDQLLVSPLQAWEILIGKTIPALIIGIGEGLFMMFMFLLFFDVPFRGSFLLLFFSMTIFLLSVVGNGLFISALSQTQQQAVLGTFVLMVPMIMLSGYATPIENMPTWLQPFTNLLAIKHFFIIIKGIFLKDMSFSEVLWHTWPMVIIAIVTLFVASWMFKSRME